MAVAPAEKTGQALKPSQRLVRWAGICFLLIVSCYGLERLLLFRQVPQSGLYGTFRSGGYYVQTVVGARTSPPLKPGSRITAVDGVPVSRWFRSLLRFPPEKGPSWSPDRPVPITVADLKGQSHILLLSLKPFATDDLWGPFWIWFLAWFILFSGAYLLFRYPGQSRVMLLSFLLLAAALSVFNHSGRHLALEMGPRLPWLILVRFAALSFIFSAWFHLILIFLSLRGQLKLPSWIPWIIYLAPPAIAFSAAVLPGPDSLTQYERSLRFLHLTAGLVVAFVLTTQIYFYTVTRDAVLKAQLKWLIWGHLIGMTPYILLYSLPIALAGFPLIQYRVALMPLPVIVFSYFFALYRYRLMDVDRVIQSSLVYGISAGLLSLGYLGALQIAGQEFLVRLGVGSWFRSDLLVLVGLAFIFNPLKNQVLGLLDRALFPERIGLPALVLEESTRISRSSNVDEIAVVLLQGLPEKLSIDRAAVALRRPFGEAWEIRQNPPGWVKLNQSALSALATLEKSEPWKTFWDLLTPEENPENQSLLLKNRGVAAVCPLKSADDLWGFYLLGEKRTHRLLNNEERRVIVTLVTQAAHLVGNARLLEGLQQTNRSLGELNSRLLQAERMADLGEGAAVLAHELKNPLGIIRGSAEILLKGRDLSQQTEILHFILEETDRLTALVDEFMQFARMAPPDKTATNLDDLVQSVAFLWESRRKAPTPLEIRFALGLRGEIVPLDSRQVYQVLLNLFANAEEALPQGGELLLATGLDQATGRAWVSVQDTGMGIPAKDLPRVFDRFFTTKDSGLGLGLALVKKVAEAHGGSVQLESAVGQGTKVTLFFPK